MAKRSKQKPSKRASTKKPKHETKAKAKTRKRKKAPPRRTPEQMRKARADYKAKRKAIQPLVFFRIPGAKRMSKRWEQKLTTYYNYVVGTNDVPGLTQGVRQRIAIKDKKKLAKAQREQGQTDLPGFKFVWVQTATDDDGDPLPVEYESSEDEDEPDTVTVDGVSERTIPFDRVALARDPDAEVERVLAALESLVPDGATYHYKINNGPWTLHDDFQAVSIPAKIRRLMAKYNSSTPNHNWKDWLHGITVEFAGKQLELKELARHREERRKRVERLAQINIGWARVLLLPSLKANGADVIILQREWDAAYPMERYELIRVLPAMREAGRLVKGDNNRWMATLAGRRYAADYEFLSDYH